MRFATWNVLTLSETGSLALITREFDLYRLQMAGLTEARLPGSGERKVSGWHFLYSGHPSRRERGVSLALNSALSSALIAWKPINDRLLSARLRMTIGHLSVLVCYAPTNIANDDDKDQFYSALDAALLDIPKSDFVVMLGDFNGTVGCDYASWPRALGRFGLGTQNENGTRLLELCTSHDLLLLGSWFQRKNIHRWSWYSNTGQTCKEIDHIAIRYRDRAAATLLRVYRGATFGATDHRLVVLEVKMPKPKRKIYKSVPKFDFNRLRQEGVRDSFGTAVNLGLLCR